jgi:glyoxylase-like metal-dependent hydrolase (beta-lactamase superfamily II)
VTILVLHAASLLGASLHKNLIFLIYFADNLSYLSVSNNKELKMSKTKQYFCLEPAHFRLDGGAMFGIIPKPMWNKVHPADEYNRIELSLRLEMIKTEEKIIIIDTGIGDYHGEKFDQRFDVKSDKSPLKLALEALNLAPDDVTDLVLSHLHFDHIGGIGELVGGEMTAVFKNAKCHIHKSHYDYAHSPTLRDGGSFHTKNFDPVLDYYKDKDLLIFHNGEEGTIIEMPEGDLKFKCSHGHTPFLMHPYDEKYIYLADLIPTSNHVHIPWVMGYDISPGVTVEDKQIFLQFVIDNNLQIIFEHDPVYWGASIKLDERKGFTCDVKFEAPKAKAYPL